jgi:hypothetical protein
MLPQGLTVPRYITGRMSLHCVEMFMHQERPVGECGAFSDYE